MRKFDAKINYGARFALTQISYQQKVKALEKAKALESLKMKTRALCNQRTKKYGPGNIGPQPRRIGPSWEFHAKSTRKLSMVQDLLQRK